MNIKELISSKYEEYDKMIADAVLVLEDAMIVNNNNSKNVLLDNAITKFNKAAALRKEIAIVSGKYLIPSPSAIDIDMKLILKEVGLTDMDDPEYGRVVPRREAMRDPSPIDSPNNDSHLNECCCKPEDDTNKTKKRGRPPKTKKNK